MGVAMAVGSAMVGLYAQNRSLEAQGQANAQTAKNMLMSMNYNLQNLEQERSDAFDATIDELEKIKIQGNRLTSQVNAAVNEGLAGGGRTANLIKRASQADVERAEVNAKDNYRRQSNEIDLNKESALLNTKSQISSIKQVEAPSLLSSLVTLGTAYYQGLQTEESIKGIQSKAGIYNTTAQNVVADTPSYNNALGFDVQNSFNFKFTYKNPYETQSIWDKYFNKTTGFVFK